MSPFRTQQVCDWLTSTTRSSHGNLPGGTDRHEGHPTIPSVTMNIAAATLIIATGS